ncbi:MAG: DUF5317 domain-containing protein [Actinobacteria bacterium]|nr:DUF5317 domain-containing protein [Actinomycetota bacterium]
MAIALGACTAVVGQGRLGRLADARVRWIVLPPLALAAQLALGLWSPTDGWPESAGLAVYLGSYGALVVFCARNLRLTGMSVVLIGVALNTLVVAVNGGMPTRLPEDASDVRMRELEESVTHVPENDAAALRSLGQIVLLPEPIDRAISFGDLILGVGLLDVIFRASRPPRRRGGRLPAMAHEGPPGDDAGQGGHDSSVSPVLS